MIKTPHAKKVYIIVVEYPHTNRTLEFIGMDRGSCIMQAEVAKQEKDTIILMKSEEVALLYKKENIWAITNHTVEKAPVQ